MDRRWALFIMGGIRQMVKNPKPTVFDQKVGYFWKGKNLSTKGSVDSDVYGQLNNIYTIQLIQAHIQRSSSDNGSNSYYIF